MVVDRLSVAGEFSELTLTESVSVTVLEDTDVVYVARFQADRVMTVSMDVGSRRPAYCTAMGRVLLGELPEPEARAILDRSQLVAYMPRTVIDKEALMEEFRKARRQGHAIIDQELEDGLVAASVPLRDCNGVALAAVNVCGHASQLTLDDLERRCLPALRECVHRISRSLVWRGAGEGPQHHSEAGRQGRCPPRRRVARPVGRPGQHEEPERLMEAGSRLHAARR